MDIMRQSACLVVNPITIYTYGFLFNCTTVGQASDSMTALTLSFNRSVGSQCLSLARPFVAQLEGFFTSICDFLALFFVWSYCVNLIRLFLCDDTFH